MYRHLGDALIDVQTVVSELVTNAVRARCNRLVLALDGHHGYVRIAATDDAAGEPTKRTPTPDHNSGRGLHVVDALSARWGVDRNDSEKTVWADVALTGDLGPTFACRD